MEEKVRAELGVGPFYDDESTQKDVPNPADDTVIVDETGIAVPADPPPPVATSTERKKKAKFSKKREERKTNKPKHKKSNRPKRDKKARRECKSPDGGRILSIMYAAILILLGIAFPSSEALRNQWQVDYVIVAYQVYLYGISIILIIVLEVCLLRRYKWASANKQKTSKGTGRDVIIDADVEWNIHGSLQPNGRRAHVDTSKTITKGKTAETHIEDINKQYTTQSTSLFLRIGVAVFGLGFMIYEGFLVKQLHENHSPSTCDKSAIIWPHYILLVFLFIQTFFIIKHSRASPKYWRPIVRIGFAHIFATNVCVWVRAILRETLDAYLYQQMAPVSSIATNDTQGTTPNDKVSCDYADDILFRASPYLFPCILQYTLLAAAAMYTMYSGLHPTSSQLSATRGFKTQDKSVGDDRVAFTEINFKKAHRGLFLGLVILAATFVSITLFFFYVDTHDDDKLPLIIYHITDISLHALLILFVVIAWLQMGKIGFVRTPILTVATVLLLLGMTGSLVFRLFKTVAIGQMLTKGEDAGTQSIMSITDCILCLVLVVLQTSFILDSMSRRLECSREQRSWTGRGNITLLLVCNLAMWVYHTFQMKELQIEGNRSEEAIYSFLAWKLIVLTLAPTLLFYHFQTSSCLAHIWYYTYQQPRDEIPKLDGSVHDEGRTITPDSNVSPPYLKVIELKRRVKKGDSGSQLETVWSPVSEV